MREIERFIEQRSRARSTDRVRNCDVRIQEKKIKLIACVSFAKYSEICNAFLENTGHDISILENQKRESSTIAADVHASSSVFYGRSTIVKLTNICGYDVGGGPLKSIKNVNAYGNTEHTIIK